MTKHQKNSYLTVVLAGVVGIALLFTACESPSEVVLSPFEEEKSYFEFVMKNDDFFKSEEEILNDPDMNNVDKEILDGDNEIRPWRTLRRVLSIDRSFSYDFIDDTTAIVTMTRTMEVRLFISGHMEPGEGNVWRDTLVTKDFTETATRKARFVKVNDTGTAEDDWKLVDISLLEGGTPERDFDIDRLKLDLPGDRSFEYDDPLNTFLRVGLGTREVPVVTLAVFRDDGYALEITVRSTQESPEMIYLRHGGVVGAQVGPGGYMRRMHVGSPVSTETTEAGEYIRRYVIDWDPFIELHNPVWRGEQIRRGRFSTVIEAVSYDTLHDIEAPVQTNYWGVPFIIE